MDDPRVRVEASISGGELSLRASVVDEDGKLKPAFLAVTNMQPEKPEIIARNSERVLTARLRDARFFWETDQKKKLRDRVQDLRNRAVRVPGHIRRSAVTVRAALTS